MHPSPQKPARLVWRRRVGAATVVLASAVAAVSTTLAAAGPAAAYLGETAITGPAGSSCFGLQVVPLTNGNVVVTDPCANGNRGAVSLIDGHTHAIISIFTGSQVNDRVGSGDVVALPNGNAVVASPEWANGVDTRAGAVTWLDGTRGSNDPVSSANSLVGGWVDSRVGSGGITVLTNGNYVVASPLLTYRPATQVEVLPHAGAATWADGSTGITGPVTVDNSLLGADDGDRVGQGGVVAMTNGGYVVVSPSWRLPNVNKQPTDGVGAVTWGDGTTGRVGLVSTDNSLVGSTAGDGVGGGGVVALTNGNFVVGSPTWDDGAVIDEGAATWGSGAGRTVGPVARTTSIHGSAAGDFVGIALTALTNGNYVVVSSEWSNGTALRAGAVTWVPGSGPAGFAVSPANSLVGSQADDHVGRSTPNHAGAIPLANGNFVVLSPDWASGAVQRAGAVTWGDGTTGTVGPVSVANSLHGSAPDDQVGWMGAALRSGDYVVGSPLWHAGGVAEVGAATWASGAGPTAAAVSAANSFTGSSGGDRTGQSVVALRNGSYLVASPGFGTAGMTSVGAVTVRPGSSSNGVVSTANSVYGQATNDFVGVWLEQSTVLADDGTFTFAAGELSSGGHTRNAAIVIAPGGFVRGPVSGAVAVVGGASQEDNALTAAVEPRFRNVYVGRPRENLVTVVPLPATGYHGLTPARILDTRRGPGATTVDGLASGTGPLAASDTLDLQVSGRAGVPFFAGAVALNVTAIDPTAAGYVTVYPAGAARPKASNLNFVAGQTVPNMVVVPLSPDGRISVFNLSGTTDLAVDVLGWFPSGSAFDGLVPARVLDTRTEPGATTIDGEAEGVGPLVGGATLDLRLSGRAGVPADAAAVVLNVTVTQPTAAGYVTVFPTGASRPTASNLDFAAGQTVPNLVVVPIGADGRVSFYGFGGSTHLAVDVLGWFAPGASFNGLVPARLLDTRTGPGIETADGLARGGGAVTGDSTLVLPVVGRGGVPSYAGSVALNVTVADPSAAGYVTVFPTGATRPTASNLNFGRGQTVPNMVIVPIGRDGTVSLYNFRGATHLVVDVLGWFPRRGG